MSGRHRIVVGVVSRTRSRRTTREREPGLFSCRRLCLRRALHGVGVTITPYLSRGGYSLSRSRPLPSASRIECASSREQTDCALCSGNKKKNEK